MKFAVTALAIAAGSTVSAQTLVAVAANPADNNFASEVISVDLPYDGNAMLGPAFGTATWAPGDMFGRTSRFAAADTEFGIPFAMADDSVSFTGDFQGIITEADTGDFFGNVDTVNNLNVSGGTAEYTWGDTGAGTLVSSVAIDMAAMGDFEAANDLHRFEISTDGGSTFNLLGDSVINQDIANSYTLANGNVADLDDPMFFNGQLLTNNFTTVTFDGLNLAVTGDIVLRYLGQQDGGAEAYAWRNASVEVIPAPASAALLGLGGLAAARRRR
ncbi:MAG: hypothetical protein AAFR76_04735 [Planctomycetota bacterium]